MFLSGLISLARGPLDPVNAGDSCKCGMIVEETLRIVLVSGFSEMFRGRIAFKKHSPSVFILRFTGIWDISIMAPCIIIFISSDKQSYIK